MLRRIGAEEGGEFKAVASGTLPSGKPVVVNADGTVSSVSQTAASVGTAVVYESANTGEQKAAFDSTNNKIVINYRDVGNSSYGTAVVGTVSGDSISFGTPVVFESSATDYNDIVFDSSTGKVVVIFSTSATGQARVGTVSGTSISFGGSVVFDSGQGVYMALAYDSSNNKVVVGYAGTNNYLETKVGTVSGTSISFGTAVVAYSSSFESLCATFDSNSNKVVFGWKKNATGRAVVGTVSGTSISYGSSVAYESSSAAILQDATFDTTNNKVVIAYRASSASDAGRAVVGTVSGTSISFGTPVDFAATNSEQLGITFDSSVGKVVIAYDDGDTSKGTVVSGTVSGTSITFDSALVYEDASVEKVTAVFDSNANKTVIAYKDAGNSNYGTGIVFSPLSNNLTSENYIGMSRGVAVQTGSADSVGSETEFINQMGNEISAAVYDPDSSKVILAYSDQDNSVRGTAIVGTVSGTSISFGTPVVYNSAETTHIGITYDTANDKVVIVYRDGAGNNNYGNAIVGTVSGTSISFGSAAVYNSATSQRNEAAFDANTGKVVIAFLDADGSVDARVATVSGTSISFGTAVQVAASGAYIKTVYDSNTNKVVVIYRGTSNYGTASVGTVSGTDISFGTPVVFYSNTTADIEVAFDSTNNKIVIGYKDGADGDKGKCVVGTVSGTSISFGSAATFHNASTPGVNGVIYNSNQNKVFFFYVSGSNLGRVVSGTVSGTTVGSFGSEFTYHDASTNVPFQVYDVASTNIVAAYRDGGDSNKGKAVVFKPDNIVTTRGQVTNGQAASVDVIGSVSDNQIGLTAGQQYYVQTDGTISTTAGSPSVLAGTAISATELVVKT